MKTKVSKTINILLRVLIMLLTLGFVYKQLQHRISWDQWRALYSETFSQSHNYWLFAVVVALFPVVILTESLKWKKLIDRLETIHLNKAFSAVMTGMAVSMFMPNRVGDYLGRVFVLEKASHIKAILVTIIGSIAQWLVLFGFGSLAVVFVSNVFFGQDTPYGSLYTIALSFVLLAVLLVLGWIYFNIGFFRHVLVYLMPKKAVFFDQYITVYSLYSKRDLLTVFLFAVLRYLIFTFQFFIMLRLLGLHISYIDAMTALALVYLAITVIPTITLTELGVRGSVAVGLFTLLFGQDSFWNEQSALVVLAASTAVWLVNVALPAIIGALLVFRLKFFREEDKWSR